MLVAICALDPVNVVPAGWIGIRGVHLLHVKLAVRHFRMAGCAGSARALVMPVMAGEATETFMHSNRRAVIAGARLRTPVIQGRN